MLFFYQNKFTIESHSLFLFPVHPPEFLMKCGRISAGILHIFIKNIAIGLNCYYPEDRHGTISQKSVQLLSYSDDVDTIGVQIEVLLLPLMLLHGSPFG